MSERYDIIAEIIHEHQSYYVTRDGLTLQAKPGLPLPVHPQVSYEKYNYKRLFREPMTPSGELEEKISRVFERLRK